MIDASVGFSDDELLKTNEPIKFKPIDVPHSHEEELRLDRLARQQREGGIVLQSNQMTPARPSTTSTPNTPNCLLYTSPSPRDRTRSRMPSSA